MQVKEDEPRIHKEVLKTTRKKNNPTEKDTEFSRHIDKGIETSNIEKIANTTWANVD